MTLPTKAIFAALVLSLAPAVASAQGFITGYGTGFGTAGTIAVPSNGYIPGGIASPINGGQPIPTQATTCGAEYLQSIVGYSVDLINLPRGARLRTPNSTGGVRYDPTQLNVGINYQRTITSVFCG